MAESNPLLEHSVSREQFDSFIGGQARKIKDGQLQPIIARTDNESGNAFQQVSHEFPFELDPDTWRDNTIFLLGVAAHRLGSRLKSAETQYAGAVIMGQSVRSIVTTYIGTALEQADVLEQRGLPLPSLLRLKRPTIDPTALSKLCVLFQYSAQSHFLHTIYRLYDGDEKEGIDMLNPKVAYLIASEGFWPSRRLLFSPEFKAWLQQFREIARTRMIYEDMERE